MLLTLGPDSGLGDTGHVLLFQQPQGPWSDLEVEDPYTKLFWGMRTTMRSAFSAMALLARLATLSPALASLRFIVFWHTKTVLLGFSNIRGGNASLLKSALDLAGLLVEL